MSGPRSLYADLASAQRHRVEAVMDCGFTERQARLLVLVMRHAGVCVPRQYASVAGIANGGRRCNAFFERLVRRGVAREISCVHNRARLYHVHHKPLYLLIGQTSSRYRRRVSARLVTERIMLLDAMLTSPTVEWLTTVERPALGDQFVMATNVGDGASPPSATTSRIAPQASSPFPLGVDPESRLVVPFLVTDPDVEGFRAFLHAQVPVLRIAPTWTIRIVFPRPLDRVANVYEPVVREELEAPPNSATLSELKWYFEQRRIAARQDVHPTTKQALDLAANVFGAPRFAAMYQRWLRHGDGVFEAPSSPALADALSTGRGRIESVVLQHSYRHLFPLATEPPMHVVAADQGLRRGNNGGNTARARPQRASSTPTEDAPLSIREQQESDWRRLVDAHKAQQAQEFRP